MAANFNLNNAGPGNVVVGRAVPGQRYRVTGFAFTFADGNGCYFRSGLTGNPISQLLQAAAGAVLTPESTGGYKGFVTNKGEPLVLAITGSGTVTGEVVYELLPPGQ